MSYPLADAINLSTPIEGNLNGKYIAFDSLPESIKILISNPKYIVLVRETTTTVGSKGGRTSGTMWYNKQILGFTVEDAVRDKKIAGRTSIPDIIQDASKFNGIPSNVYNIIIGSGTNSETVKKSLVNGFGLRVSSKSDPSGYKILEEDVYVSSNFATDRGNLAFDVVWIHGGTSEGSSAGCIIFSRTRNEDNTIKLDHNAVINLHKYLKSKGLIGKGKTQQFAIVNLWEFPLPSPTIKITGTIIDSKTGLPINNSTLSSPSSNTNTN